jgi:hypothetical protein
MAPGAKYQDGHARLPRTALPWSCFCSLTRFRRRLRMEPAGIHPYLPEGGRCESKIQEMLADGVRSTILPRIIRAPPENNEYWVFLKDPVTGDDRTAVRCQSAETAAVVINSRRFFSCHSLQLVGNKLARSAPPLRPVIPYRRGGYYPPNPSGNRNTINWKTAGKFTRRIISAPTAIYWLFSLENHV